jgi:hypothetical protein
MENWREKINRGDITEVCRKFDVPPQVYSYALKKTTREWTTAQFNVNIELKKRVEDREKFIAEQEFLQRNDAD